MNFLQEGFFYLDEIIKICIIYSIPLYANRMGSITTEAAMNEFEDRREQVPAPKKPKKRFSTGSIIAISLVGILVVLVISNLDAILSPFHKLTNILAPVTVGLVLAYILNFFLRFFEYKLFYRIKRRTVNRALSMLFSYILLLLIISGMLLLIIPSVIDSVRDLQANGLSYVNRVIDSINSVLSKIPFIQPEDGSDILNLEKLLMYVMDILSVSGTWIMSNLTAIAGSTITVLKNIVVGIFISIYVLLAKERLNAGCRRIFRALFSEKQEKALLHYFSVAHQKVGGYLIGKLADSFMVMLVCMLLFSIFDIPYAILIAVIIGVTDIIPFFGPFIGAIPSAVIIFIADPWKAVVFALLILVVQQIDGNLIAPVILGDRTGLTSLGVIVAVTVMGGVFGMVGMLIGVPLFALAITLLDDFIKHRLEQKGEASDLKTYYPADAFIRPQDIVKRDITLTQRFVGWVCSVETEVEGVDYIPSRMHAVGRVLRRALLATGRFFQRIFSIKPIPEDHTGGVFNEIAQNGMRTDRRFWRTLLLSVLTLGVYPLFMVEVISQSTNIACYKDGRRTWGVFPYLLLSVCTLGIFPLVWHCKVINRINSYCAEHGVQPRISKRFYLCWSLIGLPILVGPLIALARFLSAFSLLAEAFNGANTFPLSTEQLKADMQEYQKQLPREQRRSIIEQILDPSEDDDYVDEEIRRLSDEDEAYEPASVTQNTSDDL